MLAHNQQAHLSRCRPLCQISLVAMTTWRIVLTNVPRSVVIWDRGGGVHPSTTNPPPSKNRRGVETEIEARLSRSHRRHNDSYLHTFRLCKHLHIQKKKKKKLLCHPSLSAQCELRLHVHPCTGKAARMWRQCVRGSGGGDNSSFVCRACQYVCVTCVTHCCLRSETGIGRPMWPRVTT